MKNIFQFIFKTKKNLFFIAFILISLYIFYLLKSYIFLKLKIFLDVVYFDFSYQTVHYETFIFFYYMVFLFLSVLAVYAIWGKYRLLHINLKLKKALDTIKSQDVLQRLIMDSTENGYILFDKEGNISLVNDTFFKLFNLPESAKSIKLMSEMRGLVSSQMKNQELFINDTICVFNTLNVEKDLYELNDSRIFERLTLPVFKNDESIGRLCNFRDVTEIKTLEISLMKTKAQQKAILDNLPFMAWLKDINGKFIAVNKPFINACKHPLEDILGKDDYSIWPAEMAKLCIDYDKHVLDQKVQINNEDSIITPNGTRYFEIFNSPIFNEDGESAGTTGIVRDITYRRRIEEELKYKDKLLLAASSAMMEIAKSLDFDSSVQKAFKIVADVINVDRIILFKSKIDNSQKIYTITKKQEFLSEFVINEISVPAFQKIDIDFGGGMLDQLLNNVPVIGLTKNFSTITKEILTSYKVVSLMLIPLFVNEKLWGFISFDDCKTERVWADSEQAILSSFATSIADLISKNQQKELEKNRLKKELDIALKHANLFLWYWDIPNDHIDFSKRLADVLGYTLEEFKPEISTWDLILYLEDKASAKNMLFKYLKGEIDKYEQEYRITTKSGEIKWVLAQGEIIERDETLEPLVMTGTLIDITEMKKMQILLLQNEKMASIGELAAGMAHEINNPLGGILFACQNLKNRFRSDINANIKAAEEINISIDDINLYLQKRGLVDIFSSIQNMSERASFIISDMLSFSRKSSAIKECIDINTLIDSSINAIYSDIHLMNRHDFNKIHFIKKYSDNIVTSVRALEFEQVLVNLFKNAIQAMPQDLNDFKIEIETTLQNDSVKIVIKDNGCGMDKYTKDHAFEPFFTTKKDGVGTGLGLSVSYYIINDSHNGKILLDSEKGKGTTFTILLPLI